MVVSGTETRELSSTEVALVSGGMLAAMAVSVASVASDYDDFYCGNGLKPIPHFTLPAALAAVARG